MKKIRYFFSIFISIIEMGSMICIYILRQVITAKEIIFKVDENHNTGLQSTSTHWPIS